jgi:hypothetical protein
VEREWIIFGPGRLSSHGGPAARQGGQAGPSRRFTELNRRLAACRGPLSAWDGSGPGHGAEHEPFHRLSAFEPSGERIESSEGKDKQNEHSGQGQAEGLKHLGHLGLLGWPALEETGIAPPGPGKSRARHPKAILGDDQQEKRQSEHADQPLDPAAVLRNGLVRQESEEEAEDRGSNRE